MRRGRARASEAQAARAARRVRVTGRIVDRRSVVPRRPTDRHTKRTEAGRNCKSAPGARGCNAGCVSGPRGGAAFPPSISLLRSLFLLPRNGHLDRCGRKCAIGVALWERVGYVPATRIGVEGLLPLLHLDPPLLSAPHAHGLPRHLRPLARREEPAHGPVEVPPAARRRRSCSPRASSAASRSDTPDEFEQHVEASARGMHPGSTAGPAGRPVLPGQRVRHRARQRGPRDGAAEARRVRRHRQGRARRRRAATTSRSGTARPGPSTTTRSSERSATYRTSSVARLLLDMTKTHVPVLAGELIELVDPQPGEVAVDCTFGGGGHARLIAGRLGPEGTLIGIDRDPVAEERFARAGGRGRVPDALHPRELRRGARRAARRGPARPTSSTSTSGMSSMQVDTWERGFSYSYDAPLDMRMDPDQELTAADARQHVGGAPPRGPASRVRRGALRAADRQGDRARTRARGDHDDDRAGGDHLRARSRRRRGSPAGIRPSASSRPSASRSTRSSTRSTRACRCAWELLRAGGRFAGISFHTPGRPPREALPGRPCPRAACARPAFRSASAGTSPRPSCSRAARSRPPPARSPPTRARAPPACAPPARSRRPRQ